MDNWEVLFLSQTFITINLKGKDYKMSKKNNKDENIKIKKSSSIIVLWIVAISAVIITAAFVCANIFLIIPQKSDAVVIEELLSAALAIIGLAVSVWAGLNIVNAIERKDFESIKTEIEQQRIKANLVSQEFEAIKNKQLSSNKVKLLNEMYNTVRDISTEILIEKIRTISDVENVDFLELLEVERRFSNVYYLHSSKYSYNEGLLKEANEGILLCRKILENKTLDNVIQQYLKYRIAEFCFYSGYCCSHAEREKYFIEAITIYQSLVDFFGAQLPLYQGNQEFSKIDYKECKSDKAKISAYFCNSIGEAYSKIVEIKDRIFATEGTINDYGLKAIFYCAYASKWDEKETYLRNLGCAYERYYGVTAEKYNELYEIYEKAFNIEATVKSFKVVLSVADKYFNNHLNIKNVDAKIGRETPLSDASYTDRWSNLEISVQNKLLEVLSNISENSSYAKTIYPSNEVGYQYSCIYHRDMCLINYNNIDTVNYHLSEAKKDLSILKIKNPKGPMTKILDDDLKSLS